MSLCAFVVADLATQPAARAYEGELSLGIEGGYAHAFGVNEPGGLAGVHFAYGLASSWTLGAHADYALHAAPSEPRHVVELGTEILYVLDAVSFVPYAGIGGAVLGSVHGGELAFLGGPLATIGGQYYLSRSWLIGFDVRGVLLVNGLDDGSIPV
ncbi:MAG: hypothetical protein IT379_09655, partial [Deltaproteobacteria bacterium]|nr:hypothetical protein [Deltaproteobacteria bacterium]